MLIEDGATPVLLHNVITGHAAEGIRLTGAAASALFEQDNFFEANGEANAGGTVREM